MKNQIFISYAWGGESEEIAQKIEQVLVSNSLHVVRDKNHLEFKGLIKEFMLKIAQGNCVIIVLSDKYLKSENCMFELIEVFKYGQFHERIFPIVLNDADIYKPLGRIKYIQFWESKTKELDEAMKTVASANLQGIRNDIDLYTEIRTTISTITDKLRNLNALSLEQHLSSNFTILTEHIKKSNLITEPEVDENQVSIEDWNKSNNKIVGFLQHIFQDNSKK